MQKIKINFKNLKLREKEFKHLEELGNLGQSNR